MEDELVQQALMKVNSFSALTLHCYGLQYIIIFSHKLLVIREMFFSNSCRALTFVNTARKLRIS